MINPQKVQMESRKHQPHISHESSSLYDKGLQSIERPETVSLGNDGMKNQQFTLNRDPALLHYANKSQKRRDRDYIPDNVRPTVAARGLSEVTNKMEMHVMKDNQVGRFSVAGQFHEYKPKHLPLSAYSERFRSLPKLNHEQSLLPATIYKWVNCRATCWENRDAERRHSFVPRRRFASRAFTGNDGGKPLCIPNPALKNAKLVPVGRIVQTVADSFSSEVETAYRSNLMSTNASSNYENDQNPHRHHVRGVPKTNISLNPSREKVSYKDKCTNMIEKKGFSAEERPAKKSKSGMLDILCSATLELGPIQANPTAGCSCPRSNCIKLYCDCFKAGRHCSSQCSCVNCKNTAEETRIDGERILAIKNTLARNPRAFTGGKKDATPLNPGDVVCNCLKSRCLKLYCQCFQKGRTCNEACLCLKCLNTSAESNVGGKRNLAIQSCLEKRPDAFTKKPKEVGSGCACKNNKCLKKYCDCFRFGLPCSERCTCKGCENGKVVEV